MDVRKSQTLIGQILDELLPLRQGEPLEVVERRRRVLLALGASGLGIMPDDVRRLQIGEPRLHELGRDRRPERSEEHTSELQSLMRISYAVFCLKKKIK